MDFLYEALLRIPPEHSSSATSPAESVDTSQGLHSVDSSVHPILDTEAPQRMFLKKMSWLKSMSLKMPFLFYQINIMVLLCLMIMLSNTTFLMRELLCVIRKNPAMIN
ncbi:hypothetical protein V6N11_030758 [Hibiscus sabdariffa]|uniref:Uncharacterized protein n=1 Tax=Hibiscus sabdariffa TaxID=183260 RepID=A0ABR2NBM1_9ROSI